MRNNFEKHIRCALALFVCALPLSGTALGAAEPDSQPGYESIRRISNDLRSTLETTNRGRLLATPILEKSLIPHLQPGMFGDGTNSWQAVYISNGLVDFLNVQESQRNLLVAEDTLAQSDALVSTNLVSLYKALGGGWEELEAQGSQAKNQ